MEECRQAKRGALRSFGEEEPICCWAEIFPGSRAQRPPSLTLDDRDL